jgi:hypothetical protein
MKTTILVLCLAMGSLHAQVLPEGGHTDAPWRPGAAVDIVWRNVIEAKNVDIELWDATRRVAITIARNVPARLQSHGVILPDTLRPGSYYVVRIRDRDKPDLCMVSTGYVPVAPALQRIRTTDVEQNDRSRTTTTIAPNPTAASALVMWEYDGVRKVRVTGSDGVVRMDRDVESTERRIVLPSDRWVSGSYVVELVGAQGVIGRMLLVVAH